MGSTKGRQHGEKAFAARIIINAYDAMQPSRLVETSKCCDRIAWYENRDVYISNVVCMDFHPILHKKPKVVGDVQVDTID